MRKWKDIAAAHKAWEGRWVQTVSHQLPVAVRLDGHRFSRFSKFFRKPYDQRIFQAMHMTAADLLTHFVCSAAYTESDEITLVFPPGQGEFFHNGKTQKIASIMAGFTFARNLLVVMGEGIIDVGDDVPRRRKRLESNKVRADLVEGESIDWKGVDKFMLDHIMSAHFDARVFNLPSTRDIVDNVVWRMEDCRKNSVLNFGAQHFTTKQLNRLKPVDIRERLRNEKDLYWEDLHSSYKWGALIKKQEFLKPYNHYKTGAPLSVTRVRPGLYSGDLRLMKDDALEELLCIPKVEMGTEYEKLFVPLDRSTLMPARVNVGSVDKIKGVAIGLEDIMVSVNGRVEIGARRVVKFFKSHNVPLLLMCSSNVHLKQLEKYQKLFECFDKVVDRESDGKDMENGMIVIDKAENMKIFGKDIIKIVVGEAEGEKDAIRYNVLCDFLPEHIGLKEVFPF